MTDSFPSNKGRALRPTDQKIFVGMKHATFYATAKMDPTFPPAYSYTEHGSATFRFEQDLADWLANRPRKAKGEF